MILLTILITSIILGTIVGFIFLYFEFDKMRKLNIMLESNIKILEEEKRLILSQKKSSEIQLGQISEQLVPFLNIFPYNPKLAHFIGQPIDYIIFTDEEIIFVEIKSGQSRLTKKQQAIKKLVEERKIKWDTIKIQ